MRLYAQLRAHLAKRKIGKKRKKRKKPRASWKQHATNQRNCGGRPVPRFQLDAITRGGKASKRFQEFAQFNLFKPPTTLLLFLDRRIFVK